MIAAARSILALAILCLPVAARAATATIEAGSDERRRSLSWSGGKAAAQAALSIDPSPAFRLDAAATTLRGAARHTGADAGFDLGASWRAQTGAFRLDAGVVGHLFAGGSGPLDYAEVQGGIGTSLGPASLDLFASYAPHQNAIGGDNLYLAAQTRVAILGTPFSATGGLGHSSGDVSDAARADRLRPGGAYFDWQLGIEHARGPITVSLLYVGNDIKASDRKTHATGAAGDTVLVRLGLSL